MLRFQASAVTTLDGIEVSSIVPTALLGLGGYLVDSGEKPLDTLWATIEKIMANFR